MSNENVTLTKKELDRLIQLEMTKLDVKDLIIDNALLKWGRSELENPLLSTLRLLRNPDYVFFCCKYVLNVKLLPFQQVILQELWKSTFPMLIGSRGAGKSFALGVYAILRALWFPGRKVVITGSGFRQAKTIMNYIETIWYNAPVLRSMVRENSLSGPHHDADRWTMRLGESTITALPTGDGCLKSNTLITYDNRFGTISHHGNSVWGNGYFRKTDEHYDNGVKPTKIITTRKGFSFESTHHHRMKVMRDGDIVWVRADEMIVGDRILVDRSWRWHQGSTDITPDEAYVCGLMVGDGCITNIYKVIFMTEDSELSEAVYKVFSKRGWDFRWCGENDKFNHYLGSKKARQWFIDYFGITGLKGANKCFPANILKSSREVVSAFISGLVDSDGHVSVNTTKGGFAIVVGFTNISELLIDQLHYILLHYGIVAKKNGRYRKGNKNKVYEITMNGTNATKFHEHIGFRLKRKHDMLSAGLLSKSRDYDIIDNIPDIHIKMLEISRKYYSDKTSTNKYIKSVSPWFIQKLKGISHNIAIKFCDVYEPLVKLDSEREFINKVSELADTDIFYDKIVSIENGECHTFDIHIPDGNEYCANGFFSHNTKIRGERAHDLINDEFSSINREIYETVLAGFGVVELEPYKKVEKMAEVRVLKKLGMWSDEMEAHARQSRMGNQSVISGTAFYQFNHFADYWKRWHGIITSRGDKKKLAQVVGPEAAEDIDWRDYSIIRIPYDILPSGYLDERHVIRSKSTVHSGTFLNEFSACMHPNTLILTPYGAKHIKDIVVGDSVMTHKGRFRRVTKTMTRQSTGEILYINKDVLITYEHPIWQGGDDDNSWIKAGDIDISVGDSFHMPPLSELSSSSLSYTMGVNIGHNAYLTHEIIDPDILFSNLEFMRGFLEGYDNEQDGSYDCGDNRNLAVQIRMVLSYFNYFPTLEYDGVSYTLRNTNNDINLLPITHKDIVEYHGLVYNLEVQEDHSYVLMNGAVHNCFSSDSNGFFRRSLIEECVTNHPIKAGDDYVQFHCTIRGNPNGRYIYGVDPASEQDKFSIVILEVYDSHRRIVYCWTTDKSEHTKRIQQGVAAEHDFYGFCARKIRDLMRVFPCEHIAMDSQGGGVGIREALHDPEKLQKDEEPIWELKSSHPFNKTGSSSKGDKPTDRYPGLHILELCNFANFSYTVEANTGLRKDFEDHVCLFPISQDTATLAVAFEQDQIAKRLYDTYEDCFNEIEELKEELATIVQMPTAGGYRDRWDTPEVKLTGSRKGRLRKDRYSALVMANYAARRLARKTEEVPYQNFGGFVGQMQNHGREGPAYLSGPDWFINPVNNNPGGIGKIIRRGVK